jgi:hypothetical protein
MEQLGAVDVSQATVLASVLLANIGALVGFFISLKVEQAVLKTKFEHVEKNQNETKQELKNDIKNLGNLYRSISSKNQNQNEE